MGESRKWCAIVMECSAQFDRAFAEVISVLRQIPNVPAEKRFYFQLGRDWNPACQRLHELHRDVAEGRNRVGLVSDRQNHFVLQPQASATTSSNALNSPSAASTSRSASLRAMS